MKLLVVVGTLSGRGGIESCLKAVSEQAKMNGDSVRVLALSPSTVDPGWHQGLDYSEVARGSPSLKWQLLRGLPAVVQACRREAPDVVVTIYSSTLPMVRLALLLAGLRRPVMAWLHFSTVLKQRTNLLRFAHGHLCISTPIAEATRAVQGVNPDSVHLVYNGTRIDTAVLASRSTAGPLRIAHVGRLMVGEQKRTDDLLRALAEVDGDWQLDLVGSGDTVPQLQALAEQLGIAPRLRWLGWQAHPWDALPVADVLVMSSAFEGFGMVLIEAMARGIPCISSDCSAGPLDIIRSGSNGWLYPVGDCEALAASLQRLVDDRSRLPARAEVKGSIAMFGIDQVFERIRQAIQSTSEARGFA